MGLGLGFAQTVLSLASIFTPGRNNSGQEGKSHRASALGGESGERGLRQQQSSREPSPTRSHSVLSGGGRMDRYAAHVPSFPTPSPYPVNKGHLR